MSHCREARVFSVESLDVTVIFRIAFFELILGVEDAEDFHE